MNIVQWDIYLLDTLNFMGLFLTSIVCYYSAWSQLVIAEITELIIRSVDMLGETYGCIGGMCFYPA